MIRPEMATPRRNIIDPSKPCVCHCISRCVRRLPLLARTDDADPDRWRRTLAGRIVALVTAFAIDVIEFAIMGNHAHLLLATHPDLVALWSDREVAIRWRTLTPDYHWRRRKGIPYGAPAQEAEIAAMLADPQEIARVRRVLADVSQFHKFLKQRVAQLANAEDDVTGHFWEGRFKSIVATDAGAVIAHMVYIALNPVRAGLAESLERCTFASVRDRIEELRRRIDAGEFAGEVEAAKGRLRGLKLLPALPCNPGEDVRRMGSLPGGAPNPWRDGAVPPVVEGLTVSAFLDGADRLGRVGRKGKGTLAADLPTAMASLEARLDMWLVRGPAAVPRGVPRSPVARKQVAPASTSEGPRARSHSTAKATMTSAAAFAAPLEEALSRGVANAAGNFSGGLRSVARRAAELGRHAVWVIFDPEGRAPRRRVEADRRA